MISRLLAEEVLNVALSTGGDFAEIFAENTIKTHIINENNINEVIQRNIAGVGIRVYYGNQSTYSVTCDVSRKGLLNCA